MKHQALTPAGVVSGGMCIGCGVCSVAFPTKVRMRLTATAFNAAEELQALDEDEQELFAQMCPGLGYDRPTQTGSETTGDVMWGPYTRTLEGWASDDAVRLAGSSGGALSAVLAGLLKAGEVDAAIAVTAGRTDPYVNESIEVQEPSAVSCLSGSRYSPAAPFQALLGAPSSLKVVVVGKPCDIAALRRLKSRAPHLLPDIRYYLSFVCAGTPSWTATQGLVEHLGLPAASVTRVSYRGQGWPGRFRATDGAGREVATSYERSWGEHLNKDLHTRCKLCQDSTGAYADLVAADAWATDREGYPNFEDTPGRSFLIVRTGAGEMALQNSTHQITTRSSDIDRLIQVQSHQISRRTFAAPRALGYRLAGRCTPRFRGFSGWRLALRRPLQSARQALGSYRRAKAG